MDIQYSCNFMGLVCLWIFSGFNIFDSWTELVSG